MSTSCMVGAVGVELKATLKTRKLLISLKEKNAKNTEFAQVRYTPGTQKQQFLFYAIFNQPVVRPVKIHAGLHIEPHRSPILLLRCRWGACRVLPLNVTTVSLERYKNHLFP